MGKKIRAMGEVFYGRADVYKAALEQADETALKNAISRNLDLGETDEAVPFLAGYALRADAALQKQDVEALVRGEMGNFPTL